MPTKDARTVDMPRETERAHILTSKGTATSKGLLPCLFFFFSSRRRHTRWTGDWSSDVCSSDLTRVVGLLLFAAAVAVAGMATFRSSYAQQSMTGEMAGMSHSTASENVIDGRIHRSEERRVGKEGRCSGATGGER